MWALTPTNLVCADSDKALYDIVFFAFASAKKTTQLFECRNFSEALDQYPS
jgi:hypothetical protein